MFSFTLLLVNTATKQFDQQKLRWDERSFRRSLYAIKYSKRATRGLQLFKSSLVWIHHRAQSKAGGQPPGYCCDTQASANLNPCKSATDLHTRSQAKIGRPETFKSHRIAYHDVNLYICACLR